MRIAQAFAAALLLAATGPTGTRTTVPRDDRATDYGRFVRELKDGRTAIDYAAFRQSYTQLKRYDGRVRFDTAPAYAAIQAGKVGIALDLAEKRLDIAYADIDAHVVAVAVYRMLGLPDKADKATAIARGLMAALRATGDGKSAATSYKVVMIGEEYLVASSAGLTVRDRTELRGHDVLSVTDPKTGAKSDIWFDTSLFDRGAISANTPPAVKPQE